MPERKVSFPTWLQKHCDCLGQSYLEASFLTTDEKRAAAGYDAQPGSVSPQLKYREDQPRVPAGQTGGGPWTDGGDGGSGSNDARVRVAQANDPRKYSINLEEEDARGGHAKRDHVAKSDAELREVVERSVIRGTFVTLYKDAQGSFSSLEAANDFTNQILQKNAPSVDAVASGSQDESWLAERFGYVTGKEAYRTGPDEPVIVRPTYAAGILIRHDPRSPRGYTVYTAYPVNERSK
ncbi:RNase A-like domain-containing protein [Hyphomicrobium sp. 802]|uniref:RNase A-like domain-containing protein n=1 Tax=Hyphomicrobium sp. 802 TaxID=1112272 RepID=UPI0032AF432B